MNHITSRKNLPDEYSEMKRNYYLNSVVVAEKKL